MYYHLIYKAHPIEVGVRHTDERCCTFGVDFIGEMDIFHNHSMSYVGYYVHPSWARGG